MQNLLKFLLATALLAAVLFVAGCKKDDDDNNNTSGADILPGIGLKNVKIGDTAQKAFDAFGTVTDSYFEINGQYFHFLLYITKGVFVNLEPTGSATLDLNTKIHDIVVSDPYAGKTDKGIGIGSTKTAVQAAYGQPDSVDPLNGDEYNIGIAFDYGSGTEVTTITLFK